MICFTLSLLFYIYVFNRKHAIFKQWIFDIVVNFAFQLLNHHRMGWLENVTNRFKCIDLDGNGVLTRNELQFFYEEQLHRMECMAQEAVLFEDILCQIIDMIKPEVCLTHFLLLSVWSFTVLLWGNITWKSECRCRSSLILFFLE